MKTRSSSDLMRNLLEGKIPKSSKNSLGQTNLNVFINDVIDIVMNAGSDEEAWILLSIFFIKGEVEIN